MAIKKSDYETLSAAELREVDDREAKIDAWLNTRPQSLCFNTEGITQRVRAEVERRFRAAGWTVEHIHDQRDGAFWKFS